MWLITQYGFYSVAQESGGSYVARASVRQDLTNLIDLMGWYGSEIAEDGDSVAPYHIRLSVDALLDAFERLGKGINYESFLERLGQLPDQHGREPVYEQVRQALAGLRPYDTVSDDLPSPRLLRPGYLGPPGAVTPVSRKNIAAILRYLPLFEKEVIVEGETRVPEDHMPSWVFERTLGRFMHDTYEQGMIINFDWPAWQEEARRFVDEPGALAEADLLTLRKLLSLHVRAEKFSDGHLSAMVTSGHIPALLRRLQDILDTPAQGSETEPAPAVNYLHKRLPKQWGPRGAQSYQGSDGVRRWVRLYADPAQAYGEVLANRIYRDLQLMGLRSLLFVYEGKTGVASEVVQHVGSLEALGVPAAAARKVLDGFAADVLTANWDVAGLQGDNIVLTKKVVEWAGGTLTSPKPDHPLRIRNGGTFLMRAEGERKPAGALNAIPEWTGFFDSAVNPGYSYIAQRAGYRRAEDIPDLSKQVGAIMALRWDAAGWASYVAHYVPQLTGLDRDAIVDMLESRTALLRERVQALERAPAPTGGQTPEAG